MLSVLAIFLALLVPVVALLFLNLRFARKLDYPHHLLENANRPGPAAFLFRSFRTYYDILIDAFIALVLALAIAGELGLSPGFPFASGKEAIVVDCSASMLLGRNGSRPLDLAVAWLEKAEAAAESGEERDRPGGVVARRTRQEVFALAFDPHRGQSRLTRLDSLVRGASGDVAVTRLIENLSFFGIDYGVISSLRREGYGKITFLTDGSSPDIDGVEMVRSGRFRGQTPAGSNSGAMASPGLGFSGSATGSESMDTVFSAWPASIRFDREKGNWLVVFVQSLPPSLLGLERWNEAAAAFARLDAGAYQIESREYGWAFRISQPGIYRATAVGPMGEGPLDFTFRLVEAKRAGLASGSFSEGMMSVFPLIEKAPRPSLLFLDRGNGSDDEPRDLDDAARDRAARNPGAFAIETRRLKEDGAHYLPPAKTGGRPILGDAGSYGRDRGRDIPHGAAGRTGYLFELGPAALANPDLPLAYDGVLEAAMPPSFLIAQQDTGAGTELAQTIPDEGSSARASLLRGIIRKGRYLFVRDEYGLLPVIPPPDEYFPVASAIATGTELETPAPLPPVAFWAVLLGLAALAKILIWKWLGGGKRRFRDT